MSNPITFEAPSFAILSIDENAVRTTQWGNLAIFSVRAVAEQAMAKIPGRNKIVTVWIQPATEQ